MKYLKNFFKSIGFIVASILLLTLFFTLFNYFDFLGNKTMNIIKIIIPLFSLALGGFIIGKNSIKNGWLEGLKVGFCFVIILLIFNLIFGNNLNVKDFIFYVLLIISCIFGSMLGINSIKDEDSV